MAVVRRAEAVWNGDLMSGSGEVSAASSGAFTALPVSWAARSDQPGGKTSPEELVAAAHASCFCMALSAGLGGAGTPPERLSVSAEVTFAPKEGGGFFVKSSALRVTGRVPGIDQSTFAEAAEGAKDGCPISGAMKGNVDLSVEASLEQ
jgi:osmotically inducible protein OsmC